MLGLQTLVESYLNQPEPFFAGPYVSCIEFQLHVTEPRKSGFWLVDVKRIKGRGKRPLVLKLGSISDRAVLLTYVQAEKHVPMKIYTRR